MSGCGGFSVAGSASNLGNIAMDSSYIDVCQTGGGAMLSVGNAAEGINFTQCVCSTSCSGNSSVGILREHVQDFDVLLYPNPANNVLTISVENGVGQRVAFTIFDHSGRAVRSGDFAGESHQIGVSELAAGLYMMNLQQADGRQMSSRFVVR
jgi:putative heme degradation protein